MTAVLTTVLSYYAEHGIMTDPHEHAEMFADLPGDIPALSRIVQGLLMHGHATRLYKVKTRSDRRHEVHLRPIAQILASIKEMDERPLTIARPAHLRYAAPLRHTSSCARRLRRVLQRAQELGPLGLRVLERRSTALGAGRRPA